MSSQNDLPLSRTDPDFSTRNDARSLHRAGDLRNDATDGLEHLREFITLDRKRFADPLVSGHGADD